MVLAWISEGKYGWSLVCSEYSLFLHEEEVSPEGCLGLAGGEVSGVLEVPVAWLVVVVKFAVSLLTLE